MLWILTLFVKKLKRAMKNYKVVLKPNAQADIKDTIAWYDLQKKGLGKTFYTYVVKKIKQLQSFPFSAQNRYKNVRTAVVEKFPFLIHYYVDDFQKTIVILAVLHTSRNPEQFKK
jgi:plasmid stabilization system protein ParE